jgi:hypothetical protein
MNTPRTFRWWCATLLLAQAVSVIGCANKAYRYGDFSVADEESDPSLIVVQHGPPHKRLDRMSDIVTWPRRKLMPDRPDRRQIDPETTAKVAEYLEKNDLADVYVSVREYQPRDQWRRLRENQVVSPLSRYSFGTLSVVRYSLLPGRVFGRNAYNPYTNTLYVNSDSPALLLHEAAFAKNVHSRKLPGVYAVSRSLPFLSVVHEFESAQDVVGYAQTEKDWELEQESYREVYPRVGSSAAGGVSAVVPIWWGRPLLGLAGTAAGSVAGRTALAQREKERGRELDEMVEEEVRGRVQQASYEEPADKRKSAARENEKSKAPPPRGRRVVEQVAEP